MGNKKAWSVGILIISILLIWFLLKDISFKDFLTQIATLDWKMVFLALFCMLISAWFRNLRWLMIFAPLGYKISKFQAFSALLLSYPANLIIPQSSFFVRASYLKRKSGVSISESLGTILAEKLMDGIVVFSLFFIFIFPEFTLNIAYKADYYLFSKILLTILFFVSFTIYLVRKFAKSLWFRVKKSFLEQKNSFLLGLKATQKVKRKSLLMFYTFFIWLPYFAIFYFLLKASVFRDLNTFKLPINLAVMANIGWIFPTQGGIGSFHFFVAKIMRLHGFDNLQSVFFAFFSHGFIVFCDVFFGFCVLFTNSRSVFGLSKHKTTINI